MANECVLIVHDDPDMLAALRMALESARYQVVTADSAEEGLRRITEILPSLIILDAAVEAAARLQVSLALRKPGPGSRYADYCRVPILLLTDPCTTTSLRTGVDEAYLPVDDCVDKPVDPDVLLEKVHTLIGQTAAWGGGCASA